NRGAHHGREPGLVQCHQADRHEGAIGINGSPIAPQPHRRARSIRAQPARKLWRGSELLDQGLRCSISQAAVANRELSPSAKPIACKPTGSCSASSRGSETAGTPSSEPGTPNTPLPVLPSPDGAEPVAARVIAASQCGANSA